MSDIVRINSSKHTRFTNASHLSMHRRIYERTQLLAKPEVYRMVDALTAYGKCISSERDRTYEAKGTAFTKYLKQADNERLGMLRYVDRMIEAGELSPVEDEAKASQVLQPIVAPYKRIPREADDKKTELIDSLLTDLQKDENTEYVTTLKLTTALEALEAANNTYKQLKEQRTDEYIARSMETSEVLRKRTDEAFILVCDLIYANQLLVPEEGSLTALNKLVKEINAIIYESNLSYNISRAQKGSGKEEDNKKDDSKNPEKPEQGEEGDGEGDFKPIPVG